MAFIFNLDARGVAHIRLNRPEMHNAFNDELIDKLTALFCRLEQEDTLRLVIVTSAGKSFCAGADVAWMREQKQRGMEENIAGARGMAGMYDLMNRCPVPVISAVGGAAIGGGAGLVSVSDYVLATTDAVFGFTETRIGIVPAVISPFVLAKIGESHARAWFLSGEKFGAEQALRMGLVHEIVQDKTALDQRVKETAESFLRAAPQAARTAKKLVAEMRGHPDRTAYTSELIARVRAGDEGQEGMSALLEKRKPAWAAIP